MGKFVVTNTAPGPRGVNTTEGTVFIEPGQSAEVELSDVEAGSAKAMGCFDFEKPAAKKPEKAGEGSEK